MLLLRRFISFSKPLGLEFRELAASFNFPYGTWDIRNNLDLMREIGSIYENV